MDSQASPTPPDETDRILLVDDDATNLDALRRTLEGHGYRLFFARSGEDALTIAQRARPALILLDVVMPGIDGYEACRRLKDDPDTRDAAVIFLSALDDAKDKVRGFEAGAVDFVTKPFQGDEVLARVQTHLGIQRLLRPQHPGGPPITPQVAETERGLNDDQPPARVASGPSPPSGAAEPGGSVFHPGDVVAYRFRIVRYLAKGGMGELYEAEDLELHERVALKTILTSIADDERSILLFKREVHLARQVTHANVCRIFDVFRHHPAGGGAAAEVVFLAMELLHGETLSDRLARDGRLSTADALPIARQMAAGLSAAHRVGVVHRDFKSRNVMLVEPTPPDCHPRTVITDFGLARRSAQDDHHTSLTLLTDEPEISGTPAYMAPEQVQGGPVTPATDIYALGVVLFEVVTGTLPFRGETPLRTAVKRLQEPPPSPRIHVADLDPVWEETILRCLARAPEDRFASVHDVVQALEGGRPRDRAEDTPTPRRHLTAYWVLALLASASVPAAYFVYSTLANGRGPADITSLAVLPFKNASQNPEQEYLSDGISEGLINRLSQLPGMKVVANSSSSRYKGKDADPQEVARALDVVGILAGRIQQRDDRLSISVELIDGRDRSQVWGEQYHRASTDLPEVQAEIANAIARKLQPRFASTQQRIAAPEIRNPEAYELLLKGHFHRAKGSVEDRKKAGAYFSQAIAVDPGYALAHADLSDIYRSLVSSSLVNPAEYLPKARAAAQRALELDASLAEAHYVVANLMTYAWQWADAEREYKQAIALNPNLALAHRWYAWYLRLLRRHDEAIAEIMRARELDPLSPGVNATAGFVLASAHRYEQAIATLSRTIELDPNYAYSYLFLGHTYAAQRRDAEAIGAYEKAIALGLDTAGTQVALGAAAAQAGDPTRARAVLARLRSSIDYVSPAEMAILLAALGEREQAFALLEKAYAAHDLQLQYLAVSPGYDLLRPDPRFQNLLQRVGLPH